MKVLLTGAFGNVGSQTLESLLEHGHQVRCFDIQTRSNRGIARRFDGKVDTVWGDLRNPDDVAAAVEGRDVVIHLGFIIPPRSEKFPQLASEVNVGGTRNLLNALKTLPQKTRLIFSSTASVFGKTQHLEPPRCCTDPVQPGDCYTSHKIECENAIRESGLDWVILRFGAVPLLGQIDPLMYEVPLSNRIEFVHPRDVALALANAVSCSEASGEVLLIGGGKRGQMYFREYLKGLMDGAGVGMLPDKAFTSEQFYTDWLDTDRSQSLLRYQRYSFDDYVREMPAALGYRYLMVRAFRPLIRWYILRLSPYYRSAD